MVPLWRVWEPAGSERRALPIHRISIPTPFPHATDNPTAASSPHLPSPALADWAHPHPGCHPPDPGPGVWWLCHTGARRGLAVKAAAWAWLPGHWGVLRRMFRGCSHACLPHHLPCSELPIAKTAVLPAPPLPRLSTVSSAWSRRCRGCACWRRAARVRFGPGGAGVGCVAVQARFVRSEGRKLVRRRPTTQPVVKLVYKPSGLVVPANPTTPPQRWARA